MANETPSEPSIEGVKRVYENVSEAILSARKDRNLPSQPSSSTGLNESLRAAIKRII
jgi:hypothetical protein